MRRPPPQLCAGMSSARDRELFPLPIPPAPLVRGNPESGDTGKPCRSVHPRVLRRKHRHSWYEDGVHALNQLSGYPFSSPLGCARNHAQSVVLERLRLLYDRVAAPPSGLSAAGAFRELCGTSSRYVPSDVGGAAPYVKEYVSWPPEESVACNVVDSLGEAGRGMMFGWERNILKDADGNDYASSQQRVKPYLEPTLVRRPEVYGDFLSHLDSANMLKWRVGAHPSWVSSSCIRNPAQMVTRVSESSWTPGTSTGSSDRRRAPGSLAWRPSVPLRPTMLIAFISQEETLRIASITRPCPTDLQTGLACCASARGTCQRTRQLGAASGPTTGSSPALGSSQWGGRGACTLHKRCTSTASSMRAFRATLRSSTDSLAQPWMPCPTLVQLMSTTSCALVLLPSALVSNPGVARQQQSSRP